MNKVIRTARISDHTVVLPVQVDPGLVELPEVDEESSEEGGFTALGDQAEVVLDDDVVNPEEPEVDVEAVVAERLQEAEARFQAEKEEAVQASLEEGRAQGLAEGHAQGIEEGRAQGDQEGFARGLAEGQAQSHDEIARFQSMITALNDRWDDLFKTADQNLTELAMAIARNVVGELVNLHDAVVLDAVRDCLAHVQDRSRVVIRVNPNDLDVVRNHREEWQQAFEQIESLLIEADENIGQGGCLVETPSGDIDAQIESRLEKLKTALLEAVQGAPAEHPPELAPATSVEDVATDLVVEPEAQEHTDVNAEVTEMDVPTDVHEDLSADVPEAGVEEIEETVETLTADDVDSLDLSATPEDNLQAEEIPEEDVELPDAPEDAQTEEWSEEPIDVELADAPDDLEAEEPIEDAEPIAEVSEDIDVDMSDESDLAAEQSLTEESESDQELVSDEEMDPPEQESTDTVSEFDQPAEDQEPPSVDLTEENEPEDSEENVSAELSDVETEDNENEAAGSDDERDDEEGSNPQL